MDPSAKYVETSVSTQQRGKLIVMLYDGAVKFLSIAKDKLAEEDYALKGVYIGKAQDIILELNNSLNVEAAPEMANDLRALYNFMHRHLNEANIERSTDKLDDVIEILGQLRDAWDEVANKAGAEDAATACRQPSAGGFQA